MYLKIYFITSLSILISSLVKAQNDLTRDNFFFTEQTMNYEDFLIAYGFNQLFNFDSLDILPDKITLILKSTYSSDDSLKTAWENLRIVFNQRSLKPPEELLLDYFSFITQTSPDSVQIKVFGTKNDFPVIHVYYNNYVKFKTFFLNSMQGDPIIIPIKDISVETNSMTVNLHSKEKIKKITRKINSYFNEYYSKKGTFFYNALIDTVDSFNNSFIIRITCLNNEVISDGYFEYIEIDLEVEAIDQNIVIRFDIYCAFASGIRCPRFREKFYKPITSNNYPGKIEKYAERIRRQIKDLLIN